MIFFSIAVHALWYLSIALEAAIVLAMARRKVLFRIPFFFFYIATMLSRDIVLASIHYPSNLYARIYWYGEIVTIFLAFAVICDTVKHIFPRYPFLRVSLKLAVTLGATAALAAILMVVLTEVGPSKDRVLDFIVLAERSVKFVEAIWLILVIMLISHIGGGWRRYSVGIVAGLGVNAAITLAIFDLRMHVNVVSDAAFVLCNLAAYNAAALIWAFFFWNFQCEGAQRLPEANLSEWNDEVLAFTRRWYRR